MQFKSMNTKNAKDAKEKRIRNEIERPVIFQR